MKEILLTNSGKVALVDDEDFEWLSAFTWQSEPHRRTWYARAYYSPSRGKRAVVRMHRLILKTTSDIDHKDGNGLNNQKINLRVATNNQNQYNSRRRRDNSSGFKGVTRHWSNGKWTGKWAARIVHNGRDIWLGSFENPVDAAIAYDDKAMELRPEFARINFPERY